MYGALLVQSKEKKPALIFLSKVGQCEDQPDLYIKAHLLMSILYGNLGEQQLKEKHFSYAARMKLRESGKISPKKTLHDSKPHAETSDALSQIPTLTDEEIDALYFDLIESVLIPEGITTLASEVLNAIKDQDSPQVVKIRGKKMYSERKYEDALSIIEEYLEDKKFDVEAISIIGDAYFALQRYDESEKAYLRAIRRGADDPLIKKKLGLIYIRLKKWREAQTVFDEY